MGYFYIHNPEDFEYVFTGQAQVLWVGDDAYNTFLSLSKKGLSKWGENLVHQIITYDSQGNKPRLDKQTVLNEAFPLWEQHYNLNDLLNAILYVKEEHLKSCENDLFIIGNPGELIAQGFMKFLISDSKDSSKQIQTILLSDAAMKIAFHKEIKDLELLLVERSVHTIEVEPDSFDWKSYFSLINSEIKTNSEKNKINNHLIK